MMGFGDEGGRGSDPMAAGPEPMEEPSAHKGLSKRLKLALEAGNDERVYAILKDLVDECMMDEE